MMINLISEDNRSFLRGDPQTQGDGNPQAFAQNQLPAMQRAHLYGLCRPHGGRRQGAGGLSRAGQGASETPGGLHGAVQVRLIRVPEPVPQMPACRTCQVSAAILLEHHARFHEKPKTAGEPGTSRNALAFLINGLGVQRLPPCSTGPLDRLHLPI